jgi:hypothetical protein
MYPSVENSTTGIAIVYIKVVKLKKEVYLPLQFGNQIPA